MMFDALFLLLLPLNPRIGSRKLFQRVTLFLFVVFASSAFAIPLVLRYLRKQFSNDELEEEIEEEWEVSGEEERFPMPTVFESADADRRRMEHYVQQQRIRNVVTVYLPVPKLLLSNWRKRRNYPKDSNGGDQVLMHRDDKVRYLNAVARNIDFMYRNYVNYRIKLQTSSSADMDIVSTSSSRSDGLVAENEGEGEDAADREKKREKQLAKSALVTRMRPLFMKHKFNLAHMLMMEDVRDEIRMLSLQIAIKEAQLQQVISRLPPRFPFLAHQRFSPYFWILTQEDYRTMSYFCRSVFMSHLHQRRRLLESLNQGTAGGVTSGNVASNANILAALENEDSWMLGASPRDRQIFEHEFDIWSRRPFVRARYMHLLSQFVNRHSQQCSNLVYEEQVARFRSFCFQHLTQRWNDGRKMLKTLRMDVRKFQRERSRKQYEINRLGQLSLTTV